MFAKIHHTWSTQWRHPEDRKTKPSDGNPETKQENFCFSDHFRAQMAFRLFFFMAVFDHFHSPCYLSGAGFSLFAHHLFLSINLKEEKLLPLSLKIKNVSFVTWPFSKNLPFRHELMNQWRQQQTRCEWKNRDTQQWKQLGDVCGFASCLSDLLLTTILATRRRTDGGALLQREAKHSCWFSVSYRLEMANGHTGRLTMFSSNETLLQHLVIDDVVVKWCVCFNSTFRPRWHVVSKEPNVATAVGPTRLCNSRPPFSIYLLSFSPFSFHLLLLTSFLVSSLSLCIYISSSSSSSFFFPTHTTWCLTTMEWRGGEKKKGGGRRRCQMAHTAMRSAPLRRKRTTRRRDEAFPMRSDFSRLARFFHRGGLIITKSSERHGPSGKTAVNYQVKLKREFDRNIQETGANHSRCRHLDIEFVNVVILGPANRRRSSIISFYPLRRWWHSALVFGHKVDEIVPKRPAQDEQQHFASRKGKKRRNDKFTSPWQPAHAPFFFATPQL